MIKLIIFDFDGVIVSGSNEGYFRCYHKALEEVGVHLNPQEERRRILERWSQPYKKELEGLLEEHPELLEKATRVYESCYYSPGFLQDIQLINGAGQSLEALSKKYILTIASGMMRKTMDALLEKYKITFFKQIVTNEDVMKKDNLKPSPFMINKILQELSVSRQETVMVGDAANDVTMAQNAGVTPIGVLTGHLSKEEARSIGVKYIIEDITRLEALLKTI